MAVRLFIGNLPYSATEADLRQHLSAVGEPTQVLMPVDRETGRPRGFAFVEFADPALAQEAIRQLDGQPFLGRSLSVSEARAREDRAPGDRPPMSGPRPSRPPLGGAAGPAPPRDRSFGPPAPPRRQGGPARKHKTERGAPRGPIPIRTHGRLYAVDEDGEAGPDGPEPEEFDDFATRADEDKADDTADE